MHILKQSQTYMLFQPIPYIIIHSKLDHTPKWEWTDEDLGTHQGPTVYVCQSPSTALRSLPSWSWFQSCFGLWKSKMIGNKWSIVVFFHYVFLFFFEWFFVLDFLVSRTSLLQNKASKGDSAVTRLADNAAFDDSNNAPDQIHRVPNLWWHTFSSTFGEMLRISPLILHH